jgi:hypothetical protein
MTRESLPQPISLRPGLAGYQRIATYLLSQSADTCHFVAAIFVARLRSIYLLLRWTGSFPAYPSIDFTCQLRNRFASQASPNGTVNSVARQKNTTHAKLLVNVKGRACGSCASGAGEAFMSNSRRVVVMETPSNRRFAKSCLLPVFARFLSAVKCEMRATTNGHPDHALLVVELVRVTNVFQPIRKVGRCAQVVRGAVAGASLSATTC